MSDTPVSRGSAISEQGIILTCSWCGKYHVPESPCIDTRSPGDPQSETHGIQAVRRHYGRPDSPAPLRPATVDSLAAGEWPLLSREEVDELNALAEDLNSEEPSRSTLAIDLAEICRDGNISAASHPLVRLTCEDWKRVRDHLDENLGPRVSYADAPTSITEARAQREGDASKWTPRDVLIALLRDIDSGHITPETLVVAHASADLKQTPGFAVSSPSGTHTMGVLSQIYFRLGMRISDPPCTCP